jgi:hypothetical protein
MAELGHYELILPRLERTAIGVSVISRGLDDHARITGSSHRAMPSMGLLLVALAGAVGAYVNDVAKGAADSDFNATMDEVRTRRQRCMEAASRRALLAIDSDEAADHDEVEGEWLNYVALLVQVDRIVADLNAPLPA